MSFLDDVIEQAGAGDAERNGRGDAGDAEKPDKRPFGYSGEFDGRYGKKKPGPDNGAD
jgi:hypothetical protein